MKNYKGSNSSNLANATTRFLCLFALWLSLAPTPNAQAEGSANPELYSESAWDVLKQEYPDIAEDTSISALDRQILQALAPEEIDAFLNGDDPETILLLNGERLASFIERLEEDQQAGMVYQPMTPCVIADTRTAQGGKLEAYETRTLLARGPTKDYSAQGGSSTGCGLPRLTEGELRVNTARALFLKVELLDADGKGELEIWAANDHPRPDVSLLSYEGQGERQSVSNFVIVQMCDEHSPDPCRDGDLKLRAGGAGTHAVISVHGYFEVARIGKGISELWAQVGNDIHNTNPGRVGVGTSSPRGNLHTRGTNTLELALEAASGNPDFSLAENGDVKAQIKYLIANDGLGILTDESHTGFGGLPNSRTKLFISGTNNNLGVGTLSPGSRLTVAGTVESTSGGFKFPDGTVQTSASGGGGGVGPDTVGSAEVIDNSLTAADLGANSVGSDEISIGAVGTSEVADNSITSADLGTNSVGSAQISFGAVGTSEVADDSLTAADLGTNSVGSDEISFGAVGTSEVADNSLTASDLGAGSVGSSEIIDGSISGTDIQNGTIGTADINSSQIQVRVSSSCSSGQSIRAINSNGTVSCEIDSQVTSVDGLSGGTITSNLLVNGHLRAGFPSSSIGSGDIVADDDVKADDDVFVGDDLTVEGVFNANGDIELSANLFMQPLPTGAQTGSVCYQDTVFGDVIIKCSSSRQFKERITSFNSGVEMVEQLRPVTFHWKSSGAQDVGFIAEEVAVVHPLLVTYDDGQVAGVKYERLTALLANAVKEQQATIEELKTLVCLDHPESHFCE